MTKRIREEVDELEKKKVNIYIDTGIKGPKRRKGSYLYIVAIQTAKGTADIGNMVTVEDTTENQATLKALETALGRIHKPCDLTIYLECNYIAGVLQNGWIDEWKKNDWKTVKNEPVKDAEIWRRIEELLVIHDYEIRLKEPHEYREWMQRELKKGE